MLYIGLKHRLLRGEAGNAVVTVLAGTVWRWEACGSPSFYYPSAPSFGYGGVGSNVLRRVPMTGSGYGGTALMEGPRGPTPPGGG